MRETLDSERIRRVLKILGRRLRRPTTIYLVGGASAVLEGWREGTIDLDLDCVPDDEVYAVLPELKEDGRVNVELASPRHFLPPVPGWEERSPLITKEGVVTFRHYDFYSQALAKIERGFEQDLADVRAMVRRRLVEPERLREFASAVADDLARYPAVDRASFLDAVATFLDACEEGG